MAGDPFKPRRDKEACRGKAKWVTPDGGRYLCPACGYYHDARREAQRQFASGRRKGTRG